MKTTQTYKPLKGLQAYVTVNNVGMDKARDLLNVFLSGSGRLEKMRVPVPLIPNSGLSDATQTNLFNFRVPLNGYNRLVLAGSKLAIQVKDQLNKLSLLTYNAIFSPVQGQNIAGLTSMVNANNILHMANGSAMFRLLPLDSEEDNQGNLLPSLQGWGLNAPTFTPTVEVIEAETVVLPTAEATLAAGRVTAIQVQTPGSGMNVAPDVVIDDPFSTALATATVDGSGHVSAITIFPNPGSSGSGSGYTTPPLVKISAPNVSGDTQATAVAVLNAYGQVASVTITNPGTGYTDAPAVTIASPLPTATATANLNTVAQEITSLTLTFAGSGYESAPVVVIDPPSATSGTQATAVAEVSGGVVVALIITNPGFGYTTIPNVTISDPPNDATTATAIAAIDQTTGGVIAVILLNEGSGYLVTPQVNFTGGQSASLSFGWQWGLALKSSVINDLSNLGPTSITTGAQPAGTQFRLNFVGQIPGKTFADTYVLYRTQDGGANFYVEAEFDSFNNTYVDTGIPDGNLNLLRQAQFINNPPPIGKYLCKFGNRIIIANIVGAPGNFVWSGLEQILDGNPLSAFPPYNGGTLQIDNDEIGGVGALESGVVFFSTNNKMYIMRGQLSDITVSQPVAYTEYLQDLPFNTGTKSHFSIQSSTLGLIFWASDNNLRVYNGQGAPVIIASGAYPILQLVTPGYEPKVKSCVWQFADREWYIMAFCYNGSTVNNRILFVDISPNDAQNMGCWLSDVQADDLCVVEDANGQRQLCILQNGNVLKVHGAEASQNGYPVDRQAWPDSGQKIAAFWKGGYEGNDDSEARKLFRYADVIGDCMPVVQYELVDDDAYPFDTPYTGVAKPSPVRTRATINRRSRRASLTLLFSTADVSQNIFEIKLTFVPSVDEE